jgi:hypothetical protein
MIDAGLSVAFGKDFGKINRDLDYDNFSVEPQVKVTFNPNASVALVYGYQQFPKVGFMDKAHYVNLRLVYRF